MDNTEPGSYGSLCSEFYDATKKYASKEEIEFYSAFINKDERILEPMSGSGRLQIPLMQAGFVVDGVDNSEAMLGRCRQRCVELGLSPNLYQQSIENFSLPHKYKAAIIAVGSFQLITDYDTALKSLKNIRNHMVVGGDLFFGIFAPDIGGESFTETGFSFVHSVAIGKNKTIRQLRRNAVDIDKKIASAYCLYEEIIDGQVSQRENELIQVTWYTDSEWAQLLGKAGFEIVKFYDEPFPNNDESRIIHAQVKN